MIAINNKSVGQRKFNNHNKIYNQVFDFPEVNDRKSSQGRQIKSLIQILILILEEETGGT